MTSTSAPTDKKEEFGEDGALQQMKRDLDSRTEPAMGNQRVIFVIGGPGAGKGTQCQRLCSEFPDIIHLSAGDLLRQEQQNSNSAVGQLICKYINEGAIVPMQVTITLLEKAMRKHPNAKGFLIDGFPRAIDQGIEFERAICPSTAVIFMDCPEATMQERLLKRAEQSGRSDDNLDTIKKRFRTFQVTTLPVMEHFASKVHLVDCEGDPDQVYERFRHIVSSLLHLD